MLLSLLAARTALAAADDNSFFPLMPWNHAPADPAALKKIHDCGLTVAGFVSPDNLDRVHAAGLKAIVADNRVGGYDWLHVDEKKARENVKSLIDQVNSHPAVFGYYLRDEPSSSMFPGLEKIASVIRELAPGKWPYINLFPNYAIAEQMTEATYEKYLDKFIATCHPPILSYDHYALAGNGSLGGEYFHNLEQMRAAARKANIPFWNIVLSVATFDFAEPSAAGLRFQAYTTLAYGGRGISYFTYVAPSVGNYRLAPIDQFANETPTYSMLRNVNLQIQKLAPTILKLSSDDVYHFGKKPPAGCHGPDDKSLVSGVNDDHLMISEFTHADGSRWVMCVNKDLAHPHVCQPTFHTSPAKLQMLSAYTGALTAFEGEQVWLAAGQGVLLKVGP